LKLNETNMWARFKTRVSLQKNMGAEQDVFGKERPSVGGLRFKKAHENLRGKNQLQKE